VRVLAADIDLFRNGALVAIGVLVLLALLVMRFVTKMIFKLVFLGVLVAAGLFIYSQRNDLDDCQRRLRNITDPEERCACEFAGFEVTVPACEALTEPESSSDGGG
jgi:uncharacterized membrane protein